MLLYKKEKCWSTSTGLQWEWAEDQSDQNTEPVQTLELGLEHMVKETLASSASTVSLVTLSNPHKDVPQKWHLLRLCERGWIITSLSKETCLENLADKKEEEKRTFGSEIGRRQWGGYNLAWRLIYTVHSSLTAELMATIIIIIDEVQCSSAPSACLPLLFSR